MVTLIAVFCNRFRYVPSVVESILSQTYSHMRVILIDNGSTDGTKDYLAKAGAPVLRFPKNFGKPMALHECIKKMVRTEFYLSLDGDVVLEGTDCVETLVEAFRKFTSVYKNLAMLSPKYTGYDHGMAPVSVSIDNFSYSIAANLNPAGGCQLVLRDSYNDVGGIPQMGQLYGLDDVGLFQRLMKGGYACAYVHEAEVTHLGDDDPEHYPEWQEVKNKAHGTGICEVYEDFSHLFIDKEEA